MADSTKPTESTEPNSHQPETDKPITQSTSSDPPPLSSSSTPVANPSTPQPPTLISLPQPPSVHPFPAVPPTAPSFRPAGPPVPVPSAPQYSTFPNPNLQALPNYQSPGVQPPGVSAVQMVMMPPVTVSGPGTAPVSSVPPYGAPGQTINPAMRPYAPIPNGYAAMYQHASPGTIPPAGIPRYSSPYAPVLRPTFLPRQPFGVTPALSRPPVLPVRGPIIPPIVRPPVIPSVTPKENPQTKVYVGKIALTVENEFMLSLLQLCGPVKSWKRAQDPTNGNLKGFGFCEFESAEGVLRALRLLSKFNVDGQELMLNVDQATREYLGRYVQKKKENSESTKATESDTEEAEKEKGGGASGAEKTEPLKPPAAPPEPTTAVEDSKKDDNADTSKGNHDTATFGLVTEEDKEADKEALEKLKEMTEERLKTHPLPPPPPPPPLHTTAADGSGSSNLEVPAKSRDGDSDVDVVKNDGAEDNTKDDEMISDGKHSSEHDRHDTSSPDRRRNDRRGGRDHERDLKREKERELERYEREREQERAKREREREYKIREDERRFKARVKEWETREREREHQRKMEKEREKEREQERKWEIMDQEREGEDGYSKKRKYKSSGEDRKRRHREKEDDLADRLKEVEDIAEAKKKAEEDRERQRLQAEQDALKALFDNATIKSEEVIMPDESNNETKDIAVESTSDGDAGYGNHVGDGVGQNGISDESVMGSATSESRPGSNGPARKLGFGLIGSGKRTAVPSVFHEEDEEAHKEKKMRPLVPIDYSAEEVQALKAAAAGPDSPSPNLAAAAEFAKHISTVNPKEERHVSDKERSRRTHDRSSHRNNEDTSRSKDEGRKESVDKERGRERGSDKVKTTDNQKLLDAKGLIDMIPKTKDELFSYEINWSIYDQNGLQERMRPWLSKKITEYLGEEEPSLVDFIVSSIGDHVKGSEMLERLQSILDEEAEMFVLKMWRMLIFEIKKVETGLAVRSKS